MKKIINLWPLFIILIVFKNWFLNSFITASDWPYFFTETLLDFPLFPPAWASTHGNGLGGEVVLYALDSYMYVISWLFVSMLGFPWEIVYKVFIFGFFIFLSVISSGYLLRVVLHKTTTFQILLCSLLYCANTYILMVVDGGQVGIVLAYSIAPFVLARFIKLIQNSSASWRIRIHNSVIAGMVLALQVMFDARIAYITMIAAGLYLVLSIKYFVSKNNIYFLLYMLLYVVIIPLGITVLLHASWILPLVMFQSSPAQEVITRQTSLGAFKFFSFASFSQTLSLLHSNWPENIFGKVYFTKPEFLLLPILAYASLLFLNGKQKTKITFFVFLGVVGAFFAKGANDPFGLWNELLYRHFPGMSMFRDPTKFYVMISLSYSVLIPFSLQQISTRVSSIKYQVLDKKFNISYSDYVIPAAFVIFLLFLIRPVFLDQLRGTFTQHSMPQEYKELKDLIYNQRTFFRTLWLPRQQRYNFYSYTHPAISATGLFKATNSAEIFNRLRNVDAKQYLADISVQYIIVPYDSFGEIFVKNRKYDKEQYQDVVKQLNSIKWLEKINGSRKIAVYKTAFVRDHFWIDGHGSVSYNIVNPTEYLVKVAIQKPTTIIFAENYSSYWIAEIDNKIIKSQKTKEGLNSFLLEKAGQYRVYFEKQKIYDDGRIISATSFFLILISLWRLRKK